MKKLLIGLLFISSISFAQPQNGAVANLPPMKSYTYTQAGVIAINTDLSFSSTSGTSTTIDCRQFTALNFTVSSIGTTGVISIQWSDDPAFSGVISGRYFDYNSYSTQNAISTATRGTIGVLGAYCRFRITTATTAGTTTISLTGSVGDNPQVSILNSVNIQGASSNSASAVGLFPVTVSGVVVGTTPATVDQTYVTNDASRLPMTTGTQLIIKPFGTAELDWQYAAAASGIVNSTTAVTFKAASGTAGVRNYVTALQISWPTLGAATEIAIRDGAAGTVIWRGTLPTAAGNMSFYFPTPLKGTANTLMEVVTLTATVTGGVYFSAQGYQGF